MRYADTTAAQTAPRAPAEKLSYTLPEAVAATGLSQATLRRHAKAGRLRLFRVGGRTLADAASLRSLLTGDTSEAA